MQRIIDANINRLAEGLRVLEDIARFVLVDEPLSRQLKAMRHEARQGVNSTQPALLSSRDAHGDIGAGVEEPSDAVRQDPAGLVAANARRAQEALRVLEEAARLPETHDAMPDGYQRARFALYDIEKRMLSLLWRHDRRQAIRGLYVIIDVEQLRGRPEIEVTRQAIAGGARVIQLRDKTRPKGEIERSALSMKKACAEQGIPFIINDHVDVALAAGADGVHLGQEDLSVSAARRCLPIDRLIGCSAKTADQALQAERDGADYVAVGAMYPTTTKVKTILVGVERLREIRGKVSLPVVAIGGIGESNAAAVVAAGADAIAVISAVLSARDVEAAARRLSALAERTPRGEESHETVPDRLV